MSQTNPFDSDPLPQIKDLFKAPLEEAMIRSRHNIQQWFTSAAPAIYWDTIESPLGPLYAAQTNRGLCYLDYGDDVNEGVMLSKLDPLARSERNPAALDAVRQQLQGYFSGERRHFDLPVDISQTTPFQQQVLQMALRIPAGIIWTYGQVAKAIGKPQASRAVGRALGTNPIAIVIPCHRVIGSDGKLHGYGAGEGLSTKRWLLEFEGAM